MQEWFDSNDILMYTTHNEGKSVIGERFIKIIDTVLKTNSWTHKIKGLNGEKIIGSFYEKELLLSIL